jgi:GH24 family phage-related lysozyme (muramidase)
VALTLDRDGVLLIAHSEAMVLVPYQDGEHRSIGLGSNDPNLGLFDKITVADGFARFRRDIEPRLKYLSGMLRVPVTQNQFNALFSTYYQSGNRVAPFLVALVNAKAPPQVVAECYVIPSFCTNKAGVFKPGLEKRRQLEARVFANAEYPPNMDLIKLWRSDPHAGPPETYKVTDEDLHEALRG